MRKLLISFTVCVLVLPALAFVVWVAVIDSRFDDYSVAELFYDDCNKVWAHRGYVEKGLQRNSLASVAKAFTEGAPGVEMDVFYDVGMQQFIVSHNRPYSLKAGQILDFETVFKQHGAKGKFWLDVKNLGELTGEQLVLAAQRLSHLEKAYHLPKRIIVESTIPEALAVFKTAGVATSYWVMPNEHKNNSLLFRFLMTRYKQNILEHEFSAISLNYEDVGEKVKSELSNMPWHIFLINDVEQLTALAEEPQIKVILTDSNLFSIQNCTIDNQLINDKELINAGE